MIKFVVVSALLGAVLGYPADSSFPNIEPRIIGGEETTIAQNPWTLALMYHSQHYCGAVQISSQWALTTARCLEGASARYLSVRAGSTTKSLGGQVVAVTAKHIHPGFDLRNVDYDFGLLQLAEPITIQSSAPASLPEPNSEVLVGAEAVVIGWGTLSPGGLTSEIMHLVKVPVISRDRCQTSHPRVNITQRMFCAGDLVNGGRDACLGDAGGPAIVDGKVVGLVSWGRGCGDPDSPGVYAKISSVLEWLYTVTGI